MEKLTAIEVRVLNGLSQKIDRSVFLGDILQKMISENITLSDATELIAPASDASSETPSDPDSKE